MDVVLGIVGLVVMGWFLWFGLSGGMVKGIVEDVEKAKRKKN